MTDRISVNTALYRLLDEVRRCTHCAPFLPLGPRPVLRAASSARVLIIGQAPGTRVHASGIPRDDPSGERLRSWLQMDREQFYDTDRVAIMPMGFCYPGKGRSGDLPPRPECAPRWHEAILRLLPDLALVLLVGSHAQRYYLPEDARTLTERVRDWASCPAPYFPLVHPSPRNQLWLSRNRWFELEVIPALRSRLQALAITAPV
jgi:uracil-DNA glycosylase